MRKSTFNHTYRQSLQHSTPILMLSLSRWCYTEHPGGVLPTKWEYCSPPSQVRSQTGQGTHVTCMLYITLITIGFPGDFEEGDIHRPWPGVHGRLWNTWRGILVSQL